MLHPVRLNESKAIFKIGLKEKYLKNLGQGTNSLRPVRLNESKAIFKIGLKEKYLKNLGQGTNSLKHSRKQDLTLINK